jgi:hypothetical protein
MSLDPTKRQQFESLLHDLAACLDSLESRLRVYDKALRFGEANDPSLALTFKGWMQIVQTPGLPNFASSEHKVIVQNLLELVAHIFQVSSNLPSTEENQ